MPALPRLCAAALVLGVGCARPPAPGFTLPSAPLPATSPGARGPDTLPACRRVQPIAPGDALDVAVAGARPGDCLELQPGRYPGVTIAARGTAAAPIVIRAAQRGGAVGFTGRVVLTGAAHVVLEGFDYLGGSGVTISDGSHNRITRSRLRVDRGTFIRLDGESRDNRIDHNHFGPLAQKGHYINPTGMSERTRIDHNHFFDFRDCRGNGCEAISLGCCGPAADAHATHNVVEHNLLESCDGEGELIGMKSSHNTIRWNTIRRSRGHISFRAGKHNVAHSNYILGEGKPGSNGLRLLDEDHLIYDNYVDVMGFPIRIQHGDAPGFPPIKRVRVLNNTFIVNGDPIELGGGRHEVAPREVFFANNLVVGRRTLFSEKGNTITLANNLASGRPGIVRAGAELRIADLPLERVGEIMVPAAGSPPIGAHALMQALTGPERRGPLTPTDVGPDAP